MRLAAAVTSLDDDAAAALRGHLDAVHAALGVLGDAPARQDGGFRVTTGVTDGPGARTPLGEVRAAGAARTASVLMG